MKKSVRKTSFLILLILLILRETGTLQLNYYQNRFTTSTTTGWSGHKTEITVPYPIGENDIQKTLITNCNFSGRLSEIPITVIYKSDTIGEQSNCNHFTVNIYEINYGTLWTPFIKSTSFNASVMIGQSFNFQTYDGGKVKMEAQNIGGQVSVSGELSITGFCSYRNARQIVIDIVMKEVYTALQKYLANK